MLTYIANDVYENWGLKFTTTKNYPTNIRWDLVTCDQRILLLLVFK